MILIKEDSSKKVTGETSLWVTFDYNAQIVDAIKNVGNCIFHKAVTAWEAPLFKVKELVEKLSAFDSVSLKLITEQQCEISEPKVVTNFKTPPYAYQQEGIMYGLKSKKWLLLDAPGLGKSLQMLYLAQELKAQNEIKHCLIICGVNTLKINWAKEAQKHTDLSWRILGQRRTKRGSTVIGSVADRVADIKSNPEEFFLITNVESIRNPEVVKALNNANIDMIVVDEIHKLKTPTSQQSKGLLKLGAEYQIGLTGTILLNNPLESYVPLRWIGVEKSNYSTFKSQYIKFGGSFGNEIIGYQHIDYLKDILHKHSLRRTKDILDLPPKNIVEEYLDLENDHRLLYNNIIDGVLDQIDRVDIDETAVLGMIIRLRQATACPSLLTSENISPTKILRAVELSEDIIGNGEKVVIFSTFKETVRLLQEKLSVHNPLIITGDESDTTIAENIDKFQEDVHHKVCICTWQKAGTGITLTAARYAIFIDTPYTYGEFEQCSDRIHRIGSTDPVFIYVLLANDTIDERVWSIVNVKRAVADYVVDNKVNQDTYNLLKDYILNLKPL